MSVENTIPFQRKQPQRKQPQQPQPQLEIHELMESLRIGLAPKKEIPEVIPADIPVPDDDEL